MKLKVPMAVPILLLEKKVSRDQEQVQSEPKDCPQKQKCEITKIT